MPRRGGKQARRLSLRRLTLRLLFALKSHHDVQTQFQGGDSTKLLKLKLSVHTWTEVMYYLGRGRRDRSAGLPAEADGGTELGMSSCKRGLQLESGELHACSLL
jgi:hypothetical protein